MWKGSVQNRFDCSLLNIFPPYMTYQDTLWNFLPSAKSRDLGIKKKILKAKMMLNLILRVTFPDQIAKMYSRSHWLSVGGKSKQSTKSINWFPLFDMT